MTQDDTPQRLDKGSVEVGPEPIPSISDYAAVLWVPDPEARHWWREYVVQRDRPPKPGSRAWGFR